MFTQKFYLCSNTCGKYRANYIAFSASCTIFSKILHSLFSCIKLHRQSHGVLMRVLRKLGEIYFSVLPFYCETFSEFMRIIEFHMTCHQMRFQINFHILRTRIWEKTKRASNRFQNIFDFLN